MSSGALQIVQSSLTFVIFQVYLRNTPVLTTWWEIKKMSFSRPSDEPSKQEFHTATHEATLWPDALQQLSTLGLTFFLSFQGGIKCLG